MITASVVLFKTPVNDVKNLISSFAPSPDRQLFVLDNSPECSDDYAFLSSIDNVTYIYNGSNMGYGRASNIGIHKAVEMGSDYHVVMNPDLIFDPSVIDSLAYYADRTPDVVYILPQIVDEMGVIQPLCKLIPKPLDLIRRRFLPNVGALRKANERYILAGFGYNSIINPPCLSGCFMFMRTAALRDNGIEFDERFFLYCEDFDIIRRLHRVGRTIYYPLERVTHKEMKESYRNMRMLFIHIQSACRYFNKYGWLNDGERDEMNREILAELGIS